MIVRQHLCKNCDRIEQHELIEVVGLYWMDCTSCLESTPLGEQDVSRIYKEREMKEYRVTITRNGTRMNIDVEAHGVLDAIGEVRARFGKEFEVVDVQLLGKVAT
jgi:hypothetical protein